MCGLHSAFERFGGVPQELLFDQMRAVVTCDGRQGGSALLLNEEFLRFSRHYGFQPPLLPTIPAANERQSRAPDCLCASELFLRASVCQR